MSLIDFLILLIVAALTGTIGAALAGYTTRGCLTKIVIGLIGALIGTWLSRKLGVPDFYYQGRIPVFWSIIGAALFVAIISMLTRSRRPRRRR